MMQQKKKYLAPCVLKTVTVLLEDEILAGSVVNNSQVVSAGQEVETYNFEQPEFNHQWEN